eukprot:5937755-Pleurochrysis_carterae.AAC.1
MSEGAAEVAQRRRLACLQSARVCAPRMHKRSNLIARPHIFQYCIFHMPSEFAHSAAQRLTK